MSISAPPPALAFVCRQLPGMSGYQQVKWAKALTTCPILPSATAFFMACTYAPKRIIRPAAICTPFSRQYCTSASPSSAVMASGFSMRMCLPWSAASRA